MTEFHSVLLKVFLVVLFSRVKGSKGLNCGDDWNFKMDSLHPFGVLSLQFLALRVIKDSRTILSPNIGSLTVELSRIVAFPKYIQQFGVADCLRVEVDLDGFRVASFTGANLLVRRRAEVGAASGVPDNSFRDETTRSESLLDAPKTTGGKCCLVPHYRGNRQKRLVEKAVYWSISSHAENSESTRFRLSILGNEQTKPEDFSSFRGLNNSIIP